VRVTVAATREYYPDRRLVVAFQPHHRHRTKALFADFVDALSGIDHLFIQEIYDVAGRENDDTYDVSSRQLVEALNQRGDVAKFTENDSATESDIRQIIQPNDVVLIMGAGTIDAVARNLVEHE
jgi:UDP-N-acetylmuramate--alanine ligase